MAFLRLASLASLLAIASAGFTPPHSPHGSCSLPWLCGQAGVGDPPAVVEADLCLPTSKQGFCTLGVFMQPMPPSTKLPASTWTGHGSHGDGDFTIYDTACNVIGDYPRLLSASGDKNPLLSFPSELPYTVEFSYGNFTSQVYDGAKQGTGCICTGTASNTAAQWQQCRCPFPCDEQRLALPGSDLWPSIHKVLYPS